MSDETMIAVQIVTVLFAFASVVGMIVAVTVLLRALADISVNVHRMTGWTSRCLAAFDAMNSTHGDKGDGGASDDAGTIHSTFTRGDGEA